MIQKLDDIMTVRWIWNSLILEWWPIWIGVILIVFFVLIRGAGPRSLFVPCREILIHGVRRVLPKHSGGAPAENPDLPRRHPTKRAAR